MTLQFPTLCLPCDRVEKVQLRTWLSQSSEQGVSVDDLLPVKRYVVAADLEGLRDLSNGAGEYASLLLECQVITR